MTWPPRIQQRQLDPPAFADLAAEFLGRGIGVRFTARGSSMWPFIHDGDVLVVEPAAGETLRVGDVVLYRAGGGVMAHRLVGRTAIDEQPVLIIRGDGSRGAGDRVRPEQVLGRATQREHGGTVTDLDGWWPRLVARLWISFWPVSLRSVRLASGVLHALRSLAGSSPS